MSKSQYLSGVSKTLSTLKNIVKNEDNPFVTVAESNFSTIGYPVLIGSRAAKWHVPSFREPNDWDLVATASQSILFIDKVMANTTFKNMKLIHYSGVGLKIIGEYMDENSIKFEIELASNRVNLRNMKSIRDNEDTENNMDIDDKDSDEVEVDKMEFEKFKNDQSITSAQMILELCHNVEDKIMFPLSSFSCIVAPLKVLEALKASHIYWPTNFHKNIADLHSLRALLGYNQVPKTQPLCSPSRDEPIELMLKTRIKETELVRGIPGAHINLKKTNEEFLDREDDLFIKRRVPHDELHERVKYGDRPIYESLKNDKSKAWIEKSLFLQIDYQTQLNCVKEEAMAIALERYLIPMVSKDKETSYHLALVRICTSLTKGWFRQFAIDNYPRLSNLDKDLLPIAYDIIKNHPLQQRKKEESSSLLYKWIPDLETRAIFEPIYPNTKTILSFDDLGKPAELRNNMQFGTYRYGIVITSPVDKNISITAVITTAYLINYADCKPGADWWTSVVIIPSEEIEDLSDEYDSDSTYYDPLHLHPFDHNGIECGDLELTSMHILTLEISAKTDGESWDLEKDIWYPPEVHAKSADHIASELKIPGFTGDLLFKYVLACLQPTLENGSTPLKHDINKLKAKNVIPVEPKQHLWYDAWNYTLKHKGGKW